LEYRFWRKPLAAEVRKHWLQMFNRWIFWLLAAFILELCVMPVQFPPDQYSHLHAAYLGGIVILLLLAPLSGKRIYMATNLAFATGSIFMAIQVARINWRQSKSDGVILTAPFRGDWVVFNGGRSTVLNQNYAHNSQRDALDIERVVNGQERTGNEGNLKSYPSWGETVYAPADGKIVKAVNDLEDNAVGQIDQENPAGNCAVIDIGQGRFVEMTHLQQGSVLSRVGDVVRAGQPIAKCGNSGLAGHPMLHIQAQNQPDMFAPGTKTYPILFRDATVTRSNHLLADAPVFVRRNDIISGEPSAEKISR
jgi:hypothetical protein